VRIRAKEAQVMNSQATDLNPSRFNASADAAVRQTSVVAPPRYILLCLAANVTGYTVKAMRRKIERGDWVEGKVWRRAPDGRVLLDLVGYQKWVEGA
jgi:hypothetical protein